MPATLHSALDHRLRRNPGSPLVTFYDEATGERAELSTASLLNWVAKTQYLITDELGLAPGDRALVTLPVHWLAAPVLLGCWLAGVETTPDGSDVDVAFGDVAGLEQADLTAVPDVYAVSLLSMARSAEPPAGMSDYAAAVRPHPDSWQGVHPRSIGGPLCARRTEVDMLRHAMTEAETLGLDDGGRLLLAGSGRLTTDAWVRAVLAPLVTGGSVVLVRNPRPDSVARLTATERVTAHAQVA